VRKIPKVELSSCCGGVRRGNVRELGLLGCCHRACTTTVLV